MKTYPLIALFALILRGAPVSALTPAPEFLKDEAAKFNFVLPKIERPPLAGAPNLAARIPSYSELPRYLPSEPAYVSKDEGKIWRLAPLAGYDSFEEARSLMTYWSRLLADSGFTVTASTVTKEVLGRYEFSVTYAGEKYLALYESETVHVGAAAADSALAAAAAGLRSAGLTVVKGFVVSGGGGHMVMVYYQAHHAKDPSDRLLARRHSPLKLFAGEEAARAQAARESAALASLGIGVLETSVMSGPRGALHQLQYLGHGDTIRQRKSETYKDRAAAQAALETFVGGLRAAAVLDSEVFPSGPWYEDGHAFSVTYAGSRGSLVWPSGR